MIIKIIVIGMIIVIDVIIVVIIMTMIIIIIIVIFSTSPEGPVEGSNDQRFRFSLLSDNNTNI